MLVCFKHRVSARWAVSFKKLLLSHENIKEKDPIKSLFKQYCRIFFPPCLPYLVNSCVTTNTSICLSKIKIKYIHSSPRYVAKLREEAVIVFFTSYLVCPLHSPTGRMEMHFVFPTPHLTSWSSYLAFLVVGGGKKTSFYKCNTWSERKAVSTEQHPLGDTKGRQQRDATKRVAWEQKINLSTWATRRQVDGLWAKLN